MAGNDDMVPRGVPQPTSFQENFNKPEVPEVSLIFDSKSPFEKNAEKKGDKPVEQPAKKIPDLAPISESYNVWRYKNAHLLDHVSSRSNSFQPAPLYNGNSSNTGPAPNNAVVEPSCKPVQQDNFKNGESHPCNGGLTENRKSSLSPSMETHRLPQQNNMTNQNDKFHNQYLPPNGQTHSASSAVNLNADQGQRSPSGNHVMLHEKSYSPSSRVERHQNPSQNYPFMIDAPSIRNPPLEERHPGPLSNHDTNFGYQNGFNPRNTALTERHQGPLYNSNTNYSHQNGFDPRSLPIENRHQAPLQNPDTNYGHPNGYQMNYVHFSSVTAPVTNGVSTEALNNGCARNYNAANEYVRNCHDVPHCRNGVPPQLPLEPIGMANQGSCVVSNPYQMTNGSITKNAERKILFEDSPVSTFHSVSPCKCDTCVQKMYSKARRTGSVPNQYLARNVETHQNANRQIITTSPCSPNDRQNKVKKISTSDLYQIVQSQNEQLVLLREKVDQLLNEKTAPVCIHHCACSSQESPRKSNRTIAVQVDSEAQKSVGVMTSFQEKESRSPQPRKTPSPTENERATPNSCSCACNGQTSPKNRGNGSSEDKQEKGGSRSRKCSPDASPFSHEKNDISLTLNAANLPPVPEQIPSPEPSVHVEMQDYHSSSDDDSIESVKQNTDNRNQNGKPNGWTFYDNVIGQVNNILQNSQDSQSQSQPIPKDPISAIRQTTLEQLQKMGISVFDDKNTCEKRIGYEPPPCPQFNPQSAPNKYNGRESDLSLHMNQLAMKYLNKDQFANAVGIQQDIAVCNMNGGTNLSFTTLRYLERYHLMPAEFKQATPPGRDCRAEENFNHFQPRFENEHMHHHIPPTQPITNEILDIAALKQQRKLF